MARSPKLKTKPLTDQARTERLADAGNPFSRIALGRCTECNVKTVYSTHPPLCECPQDHSPRCGCPKQ